MTMQTEMTLADLAVTHPTASKVFHRRGLDYCCGGRRPLAEACAAAGLDPAEILQEIHAAEAAEPRGESVAWQARPLPELIDFIVGHYHARLREELPELVALAEKVEQSHAGKDTCPCGLADLLRQVHAAVLDHLAKEEQILFPLILAGAGRRTAPPIQVMEHEHRDHGENLARIRELTADLTAPDEACPTWRALYLRLDAFESELMEHIHLENNVLFPRALCE
ncbi:MAG: iron-sulfur cluster repair protein YtfE [Krumholzibacteria bacterium]|nr:iron-sulfur cluster repair protein YtfE [Candidatus Krumholzibacteria bacterium]